MFSTKGSTSECPRCIIVFKIFCCTPLPHHPTPSTYMNRQQQRSSYTLDTCLYHIKWCTILSRSLQQHKNTRPLRLPTECEMLNVINILLNLQTYKYIQHHYTDFREFHIYSLDLIKKNGCLLTQSVNKQVFANLNSSMQAYRISESFYSQTDVNDCKIQLHSYQCQLFIYTNIYKRTKTQCLYF